MAKYDIIIIGSGLGGLECGAILSKEGYNVCVLEKNSQFGGCFQTYQKQGHLLDTGIHYVGSLDEGQVMNQYFRYFGIMDKLKLQRLDESAFDRIYYKDNIYNFAMGNSLFIETLSEYFPHQRANLKRYIEKLNEVGNLIGIDHLNKGIIAQEGMKYFSTSATALISEIISDRNLQNILCGSSLLYGGIKDVSTFYQHAMINHSYIESAYRFVDGSMQVSLELIKVIQNNGGTVLKNKEVTRIIVEKEKVKGVEINNEEIIESKYVISNVHPKRTLDLLDKNHSIKNAYISRIRSLQNTYGIFTLYLVMKKESYPYINSNHYLHENDNVWYSKENNPKITNCMISMQASSKGKRYADIVSILTPMYIDELSTWENTTCGQRGEEYIRFKENKAQEILDFTRKHGIDFGQNIETMYTTTPLSYRDYTASIDGSAYGIIKNYKYPQIGFVSTRTKLRNLFLTGQNLNMHGALGVTLTALITCSEFLGQEYLAKKVGNA